MSRSYKIASIPGDGIGKEVSSYCVWHSISLSWDFIYFGTSQVIAVGIEVLQALQDKFGFKLEYTHLPWSTDLYKQTGRYMPENSLEILKQHDACVAVPHTT